ncbi:MAG TPA: WD40 repeat domain-containing protein [Gemmataceae bacterium]|nr:WD40 repeat domain-containing protein [Gemmataceae bacterium]
MDTTRIEKYRRHLRNRPLMFGGWLQNHALKTLAEDGSAEAMRALADAVANAEDAFLADAALEILRQLAAHDNVAAREALCRLVIHHDEPAARQIVSAAGYVPHEESNRALFYFLTERWDAYESLDFDHRLLRQAYDAGDARLRSRVAAKARQAGRVEWVEVVSGGKLGKRLGAMTDAEWQTALSVLQARKRWPDLWHLAQGAPPIWSAKILQRLKKARWPVPQADRETFAQLARLAAKWPQIDFHRLFHHRATLEGHQHEIRCLVISPTGQLLVSGSADHTVRLWSLPDGQLLKSLEAHAGWVHCLAISPSGALLASAGRDDKICLWRLPSGQTIKKLKGHSQTVFCLAMRPDGSLLASGSADRTVRLWSLPDGKALATLQGHEAPVSCLAMCPDGELLVSGSADGTLKLWSLPGGRLLKTLDGHRGDELDGVLCLTISRDGHLLASGGVDNMVRLWRLPDGRQLNALKGHTDHIYALAIRPDDKLLVSGGGDNAVRLWSLPNGTPAGTLDGQISACSSLVISPDGELLASASGGGLGLDHTVQFWNLEQQRRFRTLTGHARYVSCLAASPDGLTLASGGGDSTIRLWSPELSRLSRLPISRADLKDLEWLQKALDAPESTPPEKDALAFMAALLRWRRRSDILVGEAAPRVIELGEFDIEIEG